jgi:hypothetical protein
MWTEAAVADLLAYVEARLAENEAAMRDLLLPAADASSGAPIAARIAPAEIGPGLPLRLSAVMAGLRAVLSLHFPVWPDEGEPLCHVCGDPDLEMARAPWPCSTLLVIAREFAEHPGFDGSWSAAAAVRGF